MLYLKKYLTEGLIQVAILLSLAGIQVDVDPYLPPFREITLGPSSALTQTQFHNLRNSLHGYSLHPKSADLDEFFSRRPLGWVRSLDHLHVPSAELETWLVHRETNDLVSMPTQTGPLEVSNGPEDAERIGGGGGMTEMGYDPVPEEGSEAVESNPRGLGQVDDDYVIKEDGDMTNLLWQQVSNNSADQEDLHHETQAQHLESFDEEEEEDYFEELNRGDGQFHNQLVRGVDNFDQVTSLTLQSSLSLEECLQFLEGDFPPEDEAESTETDLIRIPEVDHISGQRPLLSPFLSQEASMDLELQWQDLLAIMEPQIVHEDTTTEDPLLSLRIAEHERHFGSLESFVQHDVNLHQAIQPGSHDNLFNTTTEQVHCPNSQFQPTTSNLPNVPCTTNSSLNLTLGDANLMDPFIHTEFNSTMMNIDFQDLPISFLEHQNLSGNFVPLLEGAMLAQISLMDLTLEEGLHSAQLQDQIDSDSGLSLDFDLSPSSPTESESSCSSSSSMCSSSSIPSSDSLPEEGEVGSHEAREMTSDEEGAVGGCMADQNRVCHPSLLESGHFPWLWHIGHDHTYNQPQPHLPNQRKSSKHHCDEPLNSPTHDKPLSRDERRAYLQKIPFSNEHIINLPVEEFSELVSKHKLSERQLTLIRDIRRRGKNKLAAQNCRQRKLDTLMGLEHSVDGLRRQQARLLRERSEMLRSLKDMKRRLNGLNQEISNRLRDQQGTPCLLDNGPLHLGREDCRLLSNHGKRSDTRNKSDKRQKNKK